MPEKLIEELKELMSYWNKLGDKYTVMSDNTDDSEEIELFREKARGNYKCAERLRGTLIKCGVDLKK